MVQTKLGAGAQSQLEKNNMQADEWKTFTKYKEDLEQDVSGVPKVLERIRNFSGTLFVQQREVVTFKTNRSWVPVRGSCVTVASGQFPHSQVVCSQTPGQSRFKHPVGMNRL